MEGKLVPTKQNMKERIDRKMVVLPQRTNKAFLPHVVIQLADILIKLIYADDGSKVFGPRNNLCQGIGIVSSEAVINFIF